ncbi:unnamed protein product [Dovyalis caffra]|uniref:Uncharacterized protein n=1 Tax=Dovyalis caffra TaxID=77055 RepID=A0AAV1R6Z3_9ROSI|nr:unnamed protein product [Dovyalis caffra]
MAKVAKLKMSNQWRKLLIREYNEITMVMAGSIIQKNIPFELARTCAPRIDKGQPCQVGTNLIFHLFFS